jgi:ferredoxin
MRRAGIVAATNREHDPRRGDEPRHRRHGRPVPPTTRGSGGLVFSPASFYPGRVPLDRKWLHAKVHLGSRVVLHYVRKLWPWSPRFGLARFQQNYVVEGLPPFSPEHRALAHEAGRCTSCGACDDVCPILAGATPIAADSFSGPHAFVVAGARSGPHLDDTGFALDALNGPVCAACRACDRACPESIPIAALAAHLQAQRQVVIAARAGALPIAGKDVAQRAAAARGLTGSRATSPLALPAAARSTTEER